MHAESHIDELAEISKKTNKPIIPDTKNHNFAKDGFTYRTVFFEDFDGAYYKITLSIGENNGVSTVYNVGKMKTEDIPDGNIVSTIGSKADMSSVSHSIPTTAENVNSEVEYLSSKTDQEYLSAVESGDMETAQRMVDEAAKRAGYTQNGYHGTGTDFNVFSEEHIGKRNVWGKGYYFGTNKSIADDYANLRTQKGGKYRIVSAKLKMENPFTPHKSKLDTAEGILDKWFSDMWKGSRQLGIGYINGKLENSPLDLLQFIAEHNKIEVADVLNYYGYDSVKDGSELAVFDANQIKSAEPITYDKDGNVIPLSQRFNPENEDIRYSFTDRDSAEALYDKIQRGEITKEQYLDEVSKTKQENPVTIAQMKKEEANKNHGSNE